jgi:hypothetical protein
MHGLFARFMRSTEERMIRRLLRQRDAARAEIDTYRKALGLRVGEILDGTGR